MHQDAWGKYVASPPGTTCPSGSKPGIGWDGAPDWATMTDGADTCAAAGVRELAPAVMHAWDHFYADTDGIQTELVKSWAAVATSFAGDPAVAGYDLLNEPNWGTDVDSSGAKLGAFYQRTVAAIRTAETAAGGFSHIVFFEPVVIFPTHGTLPPASDVNDPNMVFAPHNYHGSSDPGTVEQGFAAEAAAAASYGTTFWVGEYGWFGDGAEDAPSVARFAKAQDQAMVGSAWWQWRQACGDPHSVGQRGGTPADTIVEFNLNGCPGDKNLGPVPEWFPILTRGYPRSSPGRLTSLRADGPAGTVSLSGEGAERVRRRPPRRLGARPRPRSAPHRRPGPQRRDPHDGAGRLAGHRPRLQGRLLVDRRTERARALLVVRHVAAERQHLGRAGFSAGEGAASRRWSR